MEKREARESQAKMQTRKKRPEQKKRQEKKLNKVLILFVAIFLVWSVGFVWGILDERNPIEDSTVTLSSGFEVFKTTSESEYLSFLETVTSEGYRIVSINVTTTCNFFGKIVDTYFITYEVGATDFSGFNFEAEPEGSALEVSLFNSY